MDPTSALNHLPPQLAVYSGGRKRLAGLAWSAGWGPRSPQTEEVGRICRGRAGDLSRRLTVQIDGRGEGRARIQSCSGPLCPHLDGHRRPPDRRLQRQRWEHRVGSTSRMAAEGWGEARAGLKGELSQGGGMEALSSETGTGAGKKAGIQESIQGKAPWKQGRKSPWEPWTPPLGNWPCWPWSCIFSHSHKPLGWKGGGGDPPALGCFQSLCLCDDVRNGLRHQDKQLVDLAQA